MATPQILTSLHGRRVGLGPNDELIVSGSRISGAKQNALWATAPSLNDNDPSRFYMLFDDFLLPATSATSAYTVWTPVNDGTTGTPVYQDAAGGIFNVVTAAADNDYAAYSSFAEMWKFAQGKELWFEARFKIAEATTSESTWWFGLTDTLTTGGMQANAAGPLASYDGALIYKTPETAMTINFETSNAGTQNTISAAWTGVTNTWTKVGFYFDGDPTSSGTGTITPYVDIGDGNGYIAGTAQNIVLSGLEEMHICFGCKAGPSGGAETLQVDYVKCLQLR